MSNQTQNMKAVEVLTTPISEDEFFERYVKLPGKPVLIKGLATQWPAYKRWDSNFFHKNFGGFIFKVTNAKNEQIKLSMAEYLGKHWSRADTEPLYLRDWWTPYHLLSQLDAPDFSRSWHHKIPLIGRGLLSWCYFAPKNSGTPMHLDAFLSNAYNAVLSGRKQWVFIDPKWKDVIIEKRHLDALDPRFSEQEPEILRDSYTCIQEPGDVIFTPGHWCHQVHNLEAGISITENFFSRGEAIRPAEYLKFANYLAFNLYQFLFEKYRRKKVA